jgi:two-component system, NarL family, sensor kinase
MFFLQAFNFFSASPIVMGSAAMVILAVGIIVMVTKNQRNVITFDKVIQYKDQEKETALLQASIRFQEEERNRIAADLHDDAGPLLATVRLYLNENFVNLEKGAQLQAIYSAKQIIDEAIGLIRNISHKLMPPTLKNFGLETATEDLFSKIHGSGVITTSCRFIDYEKRLTAANEMLTFRILQELVNNILKHSNASFIHFIQNKDESGHFMRINHNGKGITQTEFDHLSYHGKGLGLKNIDSRIRVLGGRVGFDVDYDNDIYKVTLSIPFDEGQKENEKKVDGVTG